MQTLQDDFRKTLGRTHDIGGIHGLVGRHQHEGFDLGLVRRFGGIPGGNHIIVYPLDDVLLDDGHVLIGRRVIDRLDPIGLQNVAQPEFVVRVADESDQVYLATSDESMSVRSSR